MPEPMRSADEMVKIAMLDLELQEQLKKDPLGGLVSLRAKAVEVVPPPTPSFKEDIWMYRGIIFVLGVAVIVTVGSYLYLATIGKQIPEGLIALGSGALGALAGVLSPVPSISGK